MVAVSGALIFIGYQLTVYGWSQVKGGNAGFFDILWPGRYKGLMPDGPAAPISQGGTLSNVNAGGTIGTQKTKNQQMLNNVPKLPGTVP